MPPACGEKGGNCITWCASGLGAGARAKDRARLGLVFRVGVWPRARLDSGARRGVRGERLRPPHPLGSGAHAMEYAMYCAILGAAMRDALCVLHDARHDEMHCTMHAPWAAPMHDAKHCTMHCTMHAPWAAPGGSEGAHTCAAARGSDSSARAPPVPTRRAPDHVELQPGHMGLHSGSVRAAAPEQLGEHRLMPQLQRTSH